METGGQSSLGPEHSRRGSPGERRNMYVQELQQRDTILTLGILCLRLGPLYMKPLAQLPGGKILS